MSNIVDGRDGLGQTLRAERAKRGWTLTDLAQAADVSRAMISKIERGESSPTAVVLGKLSAALQVTVSALLGPSDPDDPEEPAGTPPVRRREDVAQWQDPGSGYRRRQISTPRFPADVTEVTLPAGARVAYPAAAYAFLAQIVWVLDGELTVVDGDRTHLLGPGDVFELGLPQPREFANDSGTGCRYVVVVSRRATA